MWRKQKHRFRKLNCFSETEAVLKTQMFQETVSGNKLAQISLQENPFRNFCCLLGWSISHWDRIRKTSRNVCLRRKQEPSPRNRLQTRWEDLSVRKNEMLLENKNQWFLLRSDSLNPDLILCSNCVRKKISWETVLWVAGSELSSSSVL